ncbi:MAG: tetratricopeptide repeat protein [Deltaproteobacteria bacterium]|nr:MAG: tetratricopeptide repeat protein [Deltaproteobacteria bacterium]
MKQFIKILFLLLITLGGYLVYHISEKPTNIFPFPYILDKTKIKDSVKAQNSDVLIIGDRMALNLNVVMESMVKESSPGFSQKLKIYNWGVENEGLHRTLKKLKSLKTVPELVIYHGASQEFFEKKFYLAERDNLNKNLKKYGDRKIMSSILFYPPLSKYFYSYDEYMILGERPIEDIRELPAVKKQIQLAMSYKIFQGELEELLRLSKAKRFKLFLMTVPLNLNIPPKETCINSISPTLSKEHQRLEKMIKEGKTKEAFSELNKLGQSVPENARNYFLLGLSLKSMGKFQEARAVLEQGTAFDCFSWRGNIIFNNIIRNTAYLKNIPLIDFDQIVNQHFGHKQLFKNEIFPLHELYKLVVEKLAKKINRFYKD